MPRRRYRFHLTVVEDPEELPPLVIEADSLTEARLKATKEATAPPGNTVAIGPFGQEVMINGGWITVAMAGGQECVSRHGVAACSNSRIGTFLATFTQSDVWVPVDEFERYATAYGWPANEPPGPPTAA